MATSAFEDWVIPIAVVILVALFFVQKRGTAKIAQGVRPGDGRVVHRDRRARAAPDRSRTRRCSGRSSRATASSCSSTIRGKAFLALGSIFLVVTGGEALYADMGHFGRRPIQISLVRARAAGAAAELLRSGRAARRTSPKAIESPFYDLAPEWAITPLAILATMATVIASQALISGAFSLTVQAVQLDYLPRLDDPPHVGAAHRPGLRAARELAADGRLRRAGDRLPHVEQPRRRVRHRRHHDDGDHDAAVLPRRPRPVGLVDAQGGRHRSSPLLLVDLAFLAANIPKIPHRRLVPAAGRARSGDPDDDVAARPRARGRAHPSRRAADGGGRSTRRSTLTSHACPAPPSTCSRTRARRRRRSSPTSSTTRCCTTTTLLVSVRLAEVPRVDPDEARRRTRRSGPASTRSSCCSASWRSPTCPTRSATMDASAASSSTQHDDVLPRP